MSVFTRVNIEQSFSRYLADKFIEAEYAVYWFNSKQTEGVATNGTVTLLRDFPENPAYLVGPSETQEDHLIKVPALSIRSKPKTTQASERQGIGESLFDWASEVRIDGFAATEEQWYTFSNLFSDWFTPDTLIELRDYQSYMYLADTPPVEDDQIRLENIMIDIDEAKGNSIPSAARYYIWIGTTARFVE